MSLTPLDRRRFLKGLGATAGAVAATATLPRSLLVKLGRTLEPIPPIQDPRLKALADRALETAKSAGATYADVRLTHTRRRGVWEGNVSDQEDMEVGVRSLVGGYWGFASGPVWSNDEMARLGAECVHQARANAVDGARVVDLAPVPKVPDGHWIMPVVRDPFEVSPFEIRDFLATLDLIAREKPGGAPGAIEATFATQEKLVATSEGSYCSQQLYRSEGRCPVAVEVPNHGREVRALNCLSPAGLGWELFTAPSIPQVRAGTLYDEIWRTIEQMRADLMLPAKPLDVGRYDTVFDAVSIQNIAAETLGRATELDRAMGYEANEGGTSYLNDPFHMAGSYQVGAQLLTLVGNRGVPGAAATVQWDDEGVVPNECTLVKDGVLYDFQTTRESAGWLKDNYARTGQVFRSHGFAAAPSAIDPPMQHVPNLAISPGADAKDYDALVAGLADGMAMEEAGADMDFQHSTGMGGGRAYEVKRGKRTARIPGAAFLFRSTEFWKALQALGGAASLRRYGREDMKGAPAQHCYYSVSAPPALVKQISFINPLRKA